MTDARSSHAMTRAGNNRVTTQNRKTDAAMRGEILVTNSTTRPRISDNILGFSLAATRRPEAIKLIIALADRGSKGDS